MVVHRWDIDGYLELLLSSRGASSGASYGVFVHLAQVSTLHTATTCSALARSTGYPRKTPASAPLIYTQPLLPPFSSSRPG